VAAFAFRHPATATRHEAASTRWRFSKVVARINDLSVSFVMGTHIGAENSHFAAKARAALEGRPRKSLGRNGRARHPEPPTLGRAPCIRIEHIAQANVNLINS
jgi:hypothetical protein